MIESWFPKTVFIKDNILLNKLNFYKNFIENIVLKYGYERNGNFYVETTHGTFDQFHNCSEMQDLCKEISNNCYEYLTKIGYNNSSIEKLKFANMWANVSKKGDYLYPHIHGESLLSGAFYVYCDGPDKIKFFDDIASNFLKTPDIVNAYSCRQCEYKCIPGRLLLFKSNLMHGTEIQKSNKKIVISFNMVI